MMLGATCTTYMHPYMYMHLSMLLFNKRNNSSHSLEKEYSQDLPRIRKTRFINVQTLSTLCYKPFLCSYNCTFPCGTTEHMNVHVPAYSHELMEGVPHPCLMKGRWIHFERGWEHGR